MVIGENFLQDPNFSLIGTILTKIFRNEKTERFFQDISITDEDSILSFMMR